MAVVFVKTSNFIRCKGLLLNTLREVKKCSFRALSSDYEIDFEDGGESTCEIQEKPRGSEYSTTATFSDGKELLLEGGKLAKFADGCVTATLNNTTVMATAVSKVKLAGSGFVPLTVVYQQKAAALGRIPLNFLRREYGQNENEILTSRLIDRSVRPLFPEKFSWETQIICNPLALDGNTFPDVLSINAASAALAISDIPWSGPVGAVRIGLIDEKFVVNPDKKQLNESSMNLIVTSKEKKYLVMMEGTFSNTLITDFMKAIKLGIKESQNIVRAIEALTKLCGKDKRSFSLPDSNINLVEEIQNLSREPLKKIFQDFSHDKMSRDGAVSDLLKSVYEQLGEKFEGATHENVSECFYKVCKEVFRDLIFETETRCDGRSVNMLRNIDCEVNLFKPLHGSALFQRGQTQVLCTVALDSPNSALKMDRVSMLTSGLKEKNFFVHYEFPPFATKEVGRMGPIGRREIGHGALAEKALKSNIPDNFPFTIRLTSEVLESNGSSSMATVCGGTLALLDAGVPMKNACAGVAMGVVTRWTDDSSPEVKDYVILTDLLGIEDYFGDMDFKVAGTKKHITAVQMDVKTKGLPSRLIMECVIKAKSAICTILKRMDSVVSQPRNIEKDNWPVLEKIAVPIHLRSKFIGPSGRNIKQLEMDAGVEITEGVAGEFQIFASNKTAMEEASAVIKELLDSCKEPTLEFGGVYTANIVEVKEHGCLVTLYPNMQPVLVHVSQLDHRKVSHPSALGMEVGQEIQVKYFGRDPVSGFMRLSRKVLQATGPQLAQTFFKKDAQPSSKPSSEAEEGQN